LVATYYTNRAICLLKLGNYNGAVADCTKSIEIDERSVKGYYFRGQALTEQKLFDEALADLKKAYQLSFEQIISYTSDILYALLHARRKKWEMEDRQRIEQQSELLRYMRRLVDEDRVRQKTSIKLNDPEKEEKVENINHAQDERLSQIQLLFEQSDENMKARDVPDYLVDKVSFNIMHDPVITTSGITYERDSLHNHFRHIGLFDPLTRRSCTEDSLIPNLALKEAIEDFLSKNGWAADY